MTILATRACAAAAAKDASRAPATSAEAGFAILRSPVAPTMSTSRFVQGTIPGSSPNGGGTIPEIPHTAPPRRAILKEGSAHRRQEAAVMVGQGDALRRS